MREKRRLFRGVIFTIFVGVFSFEVFLFASLTHSRNSKLRKGDLIAVFVGGHSRINKGIMLARQGISPNLVISPIGRKGIQRLKARLTGTGCRVIPEPHARTTYENAFYVAKIIKENHFKSVILVTSWYHMPRSYVLLYLNLLGKKVKIIPEIVGKRSLSFSTFFSHSCGIVIEFAKVWGSLIEWGLKATGMVKMGEKL